MGKTMAKKDCTECNKSNHIAVRFCACGHKFRKKPAAKKARIGTGRPVGAITMPKKTCPGCDKLNAIRVSECKCGHVFKAKKNA